MRKMKKRWLWAIIPVCLILYLVVGAVAPFVTYKDVNQDTAEYVRSKVESGMNGIAESSQVGEPNQISCDRAALLETNKSALEERIRMLNLAEKEIIMSTFDMRQGESTKDILSVILKKADEGVKVRIMVDGISGVIRMEGEELFYAISSHPNIEIKIYNRLNLIQPWKTQGRMHDKYVIVDDIAYILGGRNTFDYFIGDYPTQHGSYDREVLIYNTDNAWEGKNNSGTEESSLFEVKEYFEDIWNSDMCEYFHDSEKLREKKKVKEQTAMLEERYHVVRSERPYLFEAYAYTDHTYETKGAKLVSNPTGLYGKEPIVFYTLTEMMKNAKESVIFHSPYAVCNQYMYDTLKEVTEKVPDTTLVINSVENGDNVVAASDYLKNKKKVIDTGIKLYEYDGGMSYHAKSLVIDNNISIVGSYNLDLRSTYMDTELMLVIDSEELNQELRTYMELIQEDSRKVIDEDNYETSEHVIVADVPFWKKVAFKFLGFVLQPFRYLI